VSSNGLRSLLTAGLVLAAGRLSAQAVVTGPQATPSAAVQEFMRAAADSNLVGMAELWGTAKGPVAKTRKPADFAKRIVIMQAYLDGVSSKVLSEVAASKPEMRLVTTELARGECTVTLTVKAVKTKGGWIVQEFDLDQASQVNKSCAGNHDGGNSIGG
jgi:hypothetical protein